jgi:hypothetical protein
MSGPTMENKANNEGVRPSTEASMSRGTRRWASALAVVAALALYLSAVAPGAFEAPDPIGLGPLVADALL